MCRHNSITVDFVAFQLFTIKSLSEMTISPCLHYIDAQCSFLLVTIMSFLKITLLAILTISYVIFNPGLCNSTSNEVGAESKGYWKYMPAPPQGACISPGEPHPDSDFLKISVGRSSAFRIVGELKIFS